MAPKQVLDKAAWQWTETTPPTDVTQQHIETAYRIHVKSCDLNTCKKNCIGSPNCLNGLGIKTWLSNDQQPDGTAADISSLYRCEGEYIGLENLGATCYINAFLQVWYHNRAFRNAVLQWVDPNEQGFYSTICKVLAPFAKKNLQDLLPKSPCGHLQLIFALLAFSKRRFIIPQAFIDCLEIDTSDQQDAQEFCKLFLALLEKDATMRSVIHSQFMGTYSYVTCCNSCGYEVTSDSSFFELDLNIKGHKELEECLTEYFQDQLLKDDNRYDCHNCGMLQEAVHKLKLRTLPPVLNFQLLRFIFENGQKKKLSNYVSFPETLDMSRYLPGAAVYELFAVLIHSGQTASSGHYVALIKDPVTQHTYRFNDTEIDKFTNSKFHVRDAEILAGANAKSSSSSSSDKRPQCVKGRHSSKNAYMLVYQLQSLTTNATFSEVALDSLPGKIRRYIDIDNGLLQKEIEDSVADKKKLQVDSEIRRHDIVECCSLFMSLTDDQHLSNCEWVSTEWLKKWLSKDVSVTIPPVDNSSLICCHQRMDPNRVCEAKLVPTLTVDKLVQNYGIDTRLPCNGSMCADCVRTRCFVEFHKAKLVETDVYIKQCMKAASATATAINDDNNSTSFWVAKASLKRWRQFAIKALEQSALQQGVKLNGIECSDSDVVNCEEQNTNGLCDKSEVISVKTEERLDSVSESGNGSGSNFMERKFNESALCVHGNLTIEIKLCTLVPSDIWKRLIETFDSSLYVEIKHSDPICSQCQNINSEEVEMIHARQQAAAKQKRDLSDLFNGRKRPTPSGNKVPLYFISADFVNRWKQFVRDPTRNMPVAAVANATLLCHHGQLLYSLDYPASADDECPLECQLVCVTEDEWNSICRHFEVDVVIKKSVVSDSSGCVAGLDPSSLSPGVCDECYALRLDNEYQSQFEYDSAPVYVRRVTELNTTTAHSNGTASQTPVTSDDSVTAMQTGEEESVATKADLKRKINDESVASDAKCRRLETTANSSSTTTATDECSSVAVRRSCRRQRDDANEKQFVVSSKQTLNEFKLELAKTFKVLKTDQHVYYDGKELTADDATFQQLRIRRGALLLLRIDEPLVDGADNSMDSYLPDYSQEYAAERGFKGTLLDA